MKWGKGARKESLKRDIFQSLHDRLTHILERTPVDIEGLEFACLDVGENILSALADLNTLIQQERENLTDICNPGVAKRFWTWASTIECVSTGSDTSYSTRTVIKCIARLLGVSRATLFRRMAENNVSISASYSGCSDNELDVLITNIKSTMPDAGYSIVRGALLAKGHRVQWDRVYASMHRVDSVGVLSRMTRMGCVVRRTYTVPYPSTWCTLTPITS
ncbi:hypothetical protein F7725_009557 [Dissostichus mawsoni]|uniref:Uncharacterized protein n=1 Tax=Dissostichus mawsoni TaxID=36200 RepID=A0A7J5XMJ9_DISMA|nr:hypothetical protein F7725_009557 [Dissostichus mawsoni]